MKTVVCGNISAVLFAMVFMAPVPISAQEPPRTLLAKLAKLSAETRQRALLVGARAEKEVTFYSSLRPPQVEPFTRAFQKRYPFVKVNAARISGSKVVVRIQSEMDADERAIGIVQSGNTMLDYKARGAPLDMAILDPYLALSNSIMLAKHALHPHAAALLIDWSLSEEGQSMVTSFGRVVMREGAKPRFPELMEKEPFVADGKFLAPLLEESAREFRQIFLAGR